MMPKRAEIAIRQIFRADERSAALGYICGRLAGIAEDGSCENANDTALRCLESTARRFGKKAPATFCGEMEGVADKPPIELWTLTAPIEGHPAKSTVSRQTLESLGYVMPDAPVPIPAEYGS